MLNAESQKYFTRAYSVSGTMSPWNLRRKSHLPMLYKCLNFNETYVELLNYLKVANSTALAKCNYLKWVPSIENPNATKPFLAKTPNEIYNSDEAPVMDAMFTFASQVHFYPNQLTLSKFLSHGALFFGRSP